LVTYAAGSAPIAYLEALFPEAPKFSAHKSDLHNRAEWIVDITTKVSKEAFAPPHADSP
jgi:hypothetical protein